MAETPLPNSEEARTPTGEIKTPEAKTTPETKKEETPPITNESKSAESEKGETLLTKKEEAAPAKAPEKYEAYKLPEGFEMNETQTTEVNKLFKDLNLPQEAAQKLVDYYAKASADAAKANADLYESTRKGWRDSVLADTELGGKINEVKATVSSALDTLGDAKLAGEFRAAMDLTGAGDHPAFVKAFYKLAQKLTEGKPVDAGKPSTEGQRRPGAPQTAAHALYPNLP